MIMEWHRISRDGSPTPRLISGLGILLSLILLGEGLYVVFVSNPLGLVWVAGLVTSLPFTVGIGYAGVWLPDSSVSADRFDRIGLWSFAGLGVFLLINIIIMITMPPGSALRLISWGRWAATLGAGIGLSVGVFEAKSIERAVQTERERVRAEEAETREEFLAYLNATLRHEVLNAVSVIVGNADLALAEHAGSGTVSGRLETIKSHSRQMEAVIEDVRLLLHASQNESDVATVDVVEMIDEEIETVQTTYENLVIETSLPEHATVEGNEPLRRAFANLLRNAVEHNDSDTPRIRVTVRREPDTVVVRIADNGPGIPETEQEALFEQQVRYDDRHGLGIPLTQALVDNYDGTFELSETGSDGTVFTVTLPRASDPTRERDASNVRPANAQTSR